MKRVLFLVTMAAPVLSLACSGSPNDPSGTSGENLNWHGDFDGAAPLFDGALPPFPGRGVYPDSGFPFAIPDGGFPFTFPDGGFPFVFPDGGPPFELPDGGFDLPPWFKWPDGKFHVEPWPGGFGGFKFALPGGGFACPDKGGGFTFDGRDAGFEPPPEWPDSGFLPPSPIGPTPGHGEPPPPHRP